MGYSCVVARARVVATAKDCHSEPACGGQAERADVFSSAFASANVSACAVEESAIAFDWAEIKQIPRACLPLACNAALGMTIWVCGAVSRWVGDAS